MNQIKNMLEFFNEKYQNWMWLLVRLLMCICATNLLMYAFVTLGLIICPFIFVLIGEGLVGFLAWYFVPVSLLVTWVLYDIVKVVYEEYINIGLR